MGSLRRFNIQEILDNYHCSTLIETGTGSGDSLDYCSAFNFKKLFSIEIIKDVYDDAIKKFSHDQRIRLLNATSCEAFRDIIPSLDEDDIVLFWLDAHFPGVFCGYAHPDDEKDEDIRLPLEKELELISELRESKKDIDLNRRPSEAGANPTGQQKPADRLRCRLVVGRMRLDHMSP